MRRFGPLFASMMAAVMAADLPVRQVVLYKSGVGYFERAGALRPGESARLDFKASDMNDVLKSLTVEEKGGAKITGLRYDSSEPLADKLAGFPFHVDGQQPLSALLDQVKGARIELKMGPETLAGTVVAARIVPSADKSAEREQVVLLLDSGELRTVDLGAASSLRLTDPQLQVQLRDYLAALNQARSKDLRSVHIDSAGSGERQLRASYMIAVPLWKSSYRLIFGDAAQPTLEGWAIIDNATGEDWENVRLAVVSGRPVSFISRLYEARFLQRPTVDLPDERAQGPVLHEGAFERMDQFVNLERASLAPRAAQSKSLGSIGPAPEQRAQPLSSIAVDAESRDLGDLFEYSFSTPVTVKKNESTMLPFAQQKIGARRLLIYSETYGQNPMSAAELANSTGKTLDGGPITVFDGSSYSGEALMETLRAGDKRLISYAVDLGTRITTQLEGSRDFVREIHASRGMLTLRSAVQETKTFTIRNVDQKQKSLIIEHPVRPGYKLLNQRPVETTSNAYRFEVRLAPGATEKFPVSEERVYDNTTAVSNLSPDLLLGYIQNKSLPEAVRGKLKQISNQKRAIAENEQAMHTVETQINELVRDQERIRQNLTSLNNVSGQQEQVQRYSRQLAEQETTLAADRDTLSERRKKQTVLQSDLDALIGNLEF